MSLSRTKRNFATLWAQPQFALLSTLANCLRILSEMTLLINRINEAWTKELCFYFLNYLIHPIAGTINSKAEQDEKKLQLWNLFFFFFGFWQCHKNVNEGNLVVSAAAQQNFPNFLSQYEIWLRWRGGSGGGRVGKSLQRGTKDREGNFYKFKVIPVAGLQLCIAILKFTTNHNKFSSWKFYFSLSLSRSLPFPASLFLPPQN